MFKDFKLKLPAFARTRPLLFNRTGLSNLLNKIQFTFEVVPCLILGLFRRFFSKVCINFSPVLRGGGWEEGEEGKEEEKPPQVKTRGDQLPTDGPDHTIRPKGHHSGQGYNSRPITPNWCAPQVPMCRSWFYKTSNPPLRKADHLSLAIGDMVFG